MSSTRVALIIGSILLVAGGCYWLFVLYPILPIVLVGLVLVVGYFIGPEIIDFALGNTKNDR